MFPPYLLQPRQFPGSLINPFRTPFPASMKTQFALPWQERFNCTITILFVLVSGTSQATPPRLKLEPVVENVFSSPVAITNAGDGSGRLFVVDQRGTVHIITADDSLLPEPFLDISDKLVPERPGFDERGLLSVAFHPRFGDQPTESPGSEILRLLLRPLTQRPGHRRKPRRPHECRLRIQRAFSQQQRGRPGLRARPAHLRPAPVQPRRRTASLRSRRLPLHLHR